MYVLPKILGPPLEPNIRDLTLVCLCSVEIIRKRFQRMPVIQFIKFPANFEYLAFILVSEGKANRQICYKMLFRSMSSVSMTLSLTQPWR